MSDIRQQLWLAIFAESASVEKRKFGAAFELLCVYPRYWLFDRVSLHRWRLKEVYSYVVATGISPADEGRRIIFPSSGIQREVTNQV